MDLHKGRAADFQLDGVSLERRGVHALAEVDLEIGAGEAIGIVGPSGAGKTSLLNLLNGSVRPTSGRVRARGRALDELSRPELKELRAHVGFVHQDLSLIPNLRVSQNVMSGRLGHWGFLESLRQLLRPSRAHLDEVHRLLDRVGIPEKIFERVDRLSGGQQQRVAIARALFQGPAALIADEAVSSVDPARARATVDLLTRISREEGITLCMSLHNLELAREFLPRLVGLRGGRVVFDRASDEIDDDEFASLYTIEAGLDAGFPSVIDVNGTRDHDT